MKNLFQPIIAGSLNHDPVSRHPLVQPVIQDFEQAAEQAQVIEKKTPNWWRSAPAVEILVVDVELALLASIIQTTLYHFRLGRCWISIDIFIFAFIRPQAVDNRCLTWYHVSSVLLTMYV